MDALQIYFDCGRIESAQRDSLYNALGMLVTDELKRCTLDVKDIYGILSDDAKEYIDNKLKEYIKSNIRQI